MLATEIFDYYDVRLDAIVTSIQELVDIESPSRAAKASRDVADLIESQVASSGAAYTIDRLSVDDGDHLIIRAFPGGGATTMLLGHTDTVHPIGTKKKNPIRVEGDKFYGCGIFDMKSNVVLMIEALRFFAVTGELPVGPINIVLSCDEEVGSFTGRPLVEQEAANAGRCLVLEPSSAGKVKTGRKGTGIFTLRSHGMPAHAGLEPEKGANAVVELARQVGCIQAIGAAEAGTTVNVCTFTGGTTSNVIPDLAECQIDVRFTSMSEGERVDAALRSLKPFDSRVSLELFGAINRPPLERTDAVDERLASWADDASSPVASF